MQVARRSPPSILHHGYADLTSPFQPANPTLGPGSIEEAMQAKRQDNAGGEQRSGGGGHYGDVDRMLGVLD